MEQEEDNGHLLLDKNLRQSKNPQIKSRNEEIQLQQRSQPPQENEEEDHDEEEERDEMRMMVRYWRSKSLPYAYLPPEFGENRRVHPNNTSIDSGSGCSSVFCSDLCSVGSSGGHHTHSSSSKRTHCNYNDPGCKPGTCSDLNTEPIPRSVGTGAYCPIKFHDQRRDANLVKNGPVKNVGGVGGGSSGPSGEQVRKNVIDKKFYKYFYLSPRHDCYQ
jgi:hypothetical protein